MEKLEITTSHNIVVTVELANVFQRFVANFIDGIVILIYSGLITTIAKGSEAFIYIFVFPVLLTYHLLMEYFNDGQSIGKMLMKLKVVSLNGERPSLLDLVMRWMFRMVDIAGTVGMLAIIFISSTKKRQRIGDILADTAVVKVVNERFVSLDSILELSSKDYTITYPSVTIYKDADMLLVKDAITRYHLSPTQSNRQVVSELVTRIAKDFKIKIPQDQKIDFLRTVLNDYVVITR